MDPDNVWQSVGSGLLYLMLPVLHDWALRIWLPDKTWGERRIRFLWESLHRAFLAAVGIAFAFVIMEGDALGLLMLPGAAFFLLGAWRCWRFYRQMK